MKESKFIELLNLYIDQQITPREAARLEEEIFRNRNRREIYRQYCRMHRACALLHENFHVQNGPAVPDSELESGRQRRISWIYYAGGLAAACVALAAFWVFARREGGNLATQHNAVGTVASARPPAGETGPAPAPAASPFVHPDRPQSQPEALRPSMIVYAPDNLGQGETSLVIVHAPDPAPFEDLLMTLPTPTAVRQNLEDFVFAPPPATPGASRAYRVRFQRDSRLENTAFQFQR